MESLCDVNLWLALTTDAHVHHASAVEWFDSVAPGDRALFCRASQQGYLRLLTNEKVMGADTSTNAAAVKIYQSLHADDRVTYKREPSGTERAWLSMAEKRVKAPKLWMDCYLAAFANCARMQLVTFDKGFRKLEVDRLLLLE